MVLGYICQNKGNVYKYNKLYKYKKYNNNDKSK